MSLAMGLVADSCDQLVRRSPLRPCHVDVLRPDPKHRMVAERHRLGRGQRAKKSLISLSLVLRIVLPLVSPANFKSIVRNAQGNFLALPVFPALLAPSGRVDWSGLGQCTLEHLSVAGSPTALLKLSKLEADDLVDAAGRQSDRVT